MTSRSTGSPNARPVRVSRSQPAPPLICLSLKEDWKSRVQASLELALDQMDDLVMIHQTDDRPHLLAVPRDQDARGQTDDPAKLVSDVVVAQHDRIIYRRGLAVHIEAFILHEGPDNLLAPVVHGHAQNDEAARTVLLLKFDHPGNLHAAGLAPSGPEVHQHNFSLELIQGKVMPVQVLQHHWRDRGWDRGLRLPGSLACCRQPAYSQIVHPIKSNQSDHYQRRLLHSRTPSTKRID